VAHSLPEGGKIFHVFTLSKESQNFLDDLVANAVADGSE